MKRALLAALGLGLAVAPLAFLAAPPAHAEQSCALHGAMMTPAAMKQSLIARGYTQVRSLKAHLGCYEAMGIDSKGKHFNFELNGATGAIKAKE